MTEREQLINWLNLYSVRKGEEFTLSSGQKSNVYICNVQSRDVFYAKIVVSTNG